MAGTQAPKGFGLAFVVIGIPLIIWRATGTNRELAAMDTTEARTAQCVAKAEPITKSRSDAEAICGCVVRRAASAGIAQPHGAYDEDALRPIIGQCFDERIQS
ncbi:hypothetical protein [Sphingomonas flavescens]|uniref:hypothetical protein n=1 Tax=Sphingomonas flavescens TaxID=3132797 RepID=UPI002803814B|nr:hypothetical protein [Sphingomonas limnosediminicola]